MKYETVKVIRGLESKTISKRESDGWELVTQGSGKLRTELVLRRPKPPTPWRLLAFLGGGLAVFFIYIGTMATLSNKVTSR